MVQTDLKSARTVKSVCTIGRYLGKRAHVESVCTIGSVGTYVFVKYLPMEETDSKSTCSDEKISKSACSDEK